MDLASVVQSVKSTKICIFYNMMKKMQMNGLEFGLLFRKGGEEEIYL